MSEWSEAIHAGLLSLRITAFATVLATLVAVPLAFARSGRRPAAAGRGVWAVVESLMLLPLVLPPTVVGYLLIFALGSHGPLGAAYSLLFTEPGAVVAAAVVAVPLIYLPARAGFAGIDRDLIDTGRLFGVTGLRMLMTVSLPLAARGVAAGVTLGFARALGEFGATLMVLGLQPAKMTLPLVVWSHYETGELSGAVPALVLLMAAALVLVAAYGLLTRQDR